MMYIKLIKDYEDNNLVCYFFETKIPGDLEITNPGQKKYQLIKKMGYCSFNKKTNEFFTDKEKTDDYFFKSERELIKIYVKLIRLNSLGEFPSIDDIAGG